MFTSLEAARALFYLDLNQNKTFLLQCGSMDFNVQYKNYGLTKDAHMNF